MNKKKRTPGDAGETPLPQTAPDYKHLRFQQVPLSIRNNAVERVLAGESRQIDIADELGVRRQTVHAWVKRARQGSLQKKRGAQYP